jgi:hypothetical protein
MECGLFSVHVGAEADRFDLMRSDAMNCQHHAIAHLLGFSTHSGKYMETDFHFLGCMSDVPWPVQIESI